MKKITLISVLVMSLLLSACSYNKSIGIIGGADGPTSIIVSDGNGEDFVKKPVRMIKVDGEIYYDSGLMSEMSPRCGTLDGHLIKCANEGEIPQEDNGANFNKDDYFGYQNTTGITKEVPLDGGWAIFKKFGYGAVGLNNATVPGKDKLKYCFYMKGRLPNAKSDWELIVLSEDKDVTFKDVTEPLYSSKYDPNENKPQSAFVFLNNPDEWGLTLYADDVSAEGLMLYFEQFGGSFKGSLETGEWYSLQINNDGNWEPVAPILEEGTYAWHTIAYGILNNDLTELKVDWEWLYGTLEKGYYRIGKKVTDFAFPGDNETKTYYAEFKIE